MFSQDARLRLQEETDRQDRERSQEFEYPVNERESDNVCHDGGDDD